MGIIWYNHTILAWPASKVKGHARGFDDAPHSDLGDSFSICSFCMVAAALAFKFIPFMDYKHLANRMGTAPGFRPHLRCVIPLCRFLAYGSPPTVKDFPSLQVSDLNRILLRWPNHTGSDVQVVSGEFANPKVFPRLQDNQLLHLSGSGRMSSVSDGNKKPI